METSKNEINRLGIRIRKEGKNISDKTLLELEEYRTSHKKILSDVFQKLIDIRRREFSNNTIVTYRIKRFESIINKLNRFPDMAFSRMGDIAGCRIIVNTDYEIYKFKEEIQKVLTVKKINDYIETPQEDGYRSLHLYVETPNVKKTIEIQLRTREDHNWATLVEITDLLFDSHLKEYGENKELYKLHQLLAYTDDLSFEERKIVAKILIKYNYLEKINDVFSRNYINVREQWLGIETNSKQKYILIISSKNEIPIISAFENFQNAEDKYFENFKQNQKANIVLTYLPKPNYQHISMAYSNYILTVHSFEDESLNIFESLALQYLRKGRFIAFARYYDFYLNIFTRRLSNSIREYSHYEKAKSKKTSKRFIKKEREWRDDINEESEKFKKVNTKFKNELNKVIAQNKINIRITIFILNIIAKKYRKRLKKYLKKMN